MLCLFKYLFIADNVIKNKELFEEEIPKTRSNHFFIHHNSGITFTFMRYIYTSTIKKGDLGHYGYTLTDDFFKGTNNEIHEYDTIKNVLFNVKWNAVSTDSVRFTDLTTLKTKGYIQNNDSPILLHQLITSRLNDEDTHHIGHTFDNRKAFLMPTTSCRNNEIHGVERRDGITCRSTEINNDWNIRPYHNLLKAVKKNPTCNECKKCDMKLIIRDKTELNNLIEQLSNTEYYNLLNANR